MKVIAVTNSKRLIKGNQYEIAYLYNSNPRQNGRLGLKELVGSFRTSAFTKLDGSEIDKINIQIERSSRVRIDDIIVGDILVCNSGHIALIKNGFYKIEKININNHTVKLEGIDRPYKYNNFRKVSTQEAREINLEKVINKNDLIKKKGLRKVDYLENKELELMKVISLSITDIYRHKLDILDWGISKSAKKLGLIREDFNELKEMKLKDILSLIDKTKE